MYRLYAVNYCQYFSSISANTSEPITLLIHSPDHKPAYWCERDPQDLLLNLDLEYTNPDLTMYVNTKDKELIHLHLMVTSVFLFAILAAVIIAFVLRNVNSTKKFAADSRGDHHMVNMNSISSSSED